MMARRGLGRRALRAGMVIVLGATLGCAGAVRPADATTVASMTTAAQATSADRIFVGTVVSTTSRPKADAPKYFETVVRFSVEETVAGGMPATVELTLSGGEVGGIRQRVDGMPELVIGERYVVLLEADQQPRLTSPFVGFNQGLYRVVGETRANAVVRDHRGRALTGDAVPAGARSAGTEPGVDAFVEQLRAFRRDAQRP